MKNIIIKKESFFVACVALLVIILASPLSSFHRKSIEKSFGEKINDCPYIFYEQGKVVVKWIEEGILFEKSYSNNKFKKLKIASCEDFEAKYLKTNSKALIDNKQNFTDVPNIAILSDIHGQHDLFIDLMKAHKIIDEEGNWDYADGHFVLVGDVFDRGDKVTETLWFLYKLEQQAAKAGGKVHFLLGNHEIMVLKGDLRYISDKYIKVSEKMGIAYDELFSDNTLIGQWLRTKPVAISINKIAFSHAGFSPEFANRKFNIELTNRLFHEEIIDHTKDSIMTNEVLKFMVKSKGPVWYRGYFKDEEFDKQAAQKILDGMEMKTIVVGHTSMKRVMSHFDGLIYSVDSSIKKGEYGEILFWEKGQFLRGTLTGELIQF